MPPLPNDLKKPLVKDRYFIEELDGAAIRAEQEERFKSLFAHLEITHGDWESLARVLASEFIPGCQIKEPSRVGAPAKWYWERQHALMSAVDEIKANSDLSDRRAISVLVKKEPLKWGIPPGANGDELRRKKKSLENRLSEIRIALASYWAKKDCS